MCLHFPSHWGPGLTSLISLPCFLELPSLALGSGGSGTNPPRTSQAAVDFQRHSSVAPKGITYWW